jgi:hypothetical protein
MPEAVKRNRELSNGRALKVQVQAELLRYERGCVRVCMLWILGEKELPMSNERTN